MTPKYNAQETDDARASEFQSSPRSPGLSGLNPHQVAARGFAQTIGLLPGMAVVTVGVDLMVQSAAIISAGLLLPVSIGVGAVLGFITYRAQMRFYGDDDEAAKIKGLIVALLSAIPSPLPYVLFVPAGLVGWLGRKGR